MSNNTLVLEERLDFLMQQQTQSNLFMIQQVEESMQQSASEDFANSSPLQEHSQQYHYQPLALYKPEPGDEQQRNMVQQRQSSFVVVKANKNKEQ